MVKLALVQWTDAHVPHGTWVHLDELKDDGYYEVNTIGYVLDTKMGGKKNHVSICQSWGEDDYVDGILHIPTKMVKQIIILQEEATVMHRNDIESAVQYLTRVTPRGNDDQSRLVNLIEKMQSFIQEPNSSQMNSVLHGRQKN